VRQFDFSIKQWQLSSEEKERLLRGESEVREARLFALRYQLNPHFLVNSLNGISTTLVLDGNAPAATQMLAQIGDLQRTNLDTSRSTAWRTKPSVHRIAHSARRLDTDYEPSLGYALTTVRTAM
jgi:LytS/YehU family sensor histidine kinase